MIRSISNRICCAVLIFLEADGVYVQDSTARKSTYIFAVIIAKGQQDGPKIARCDHAIAISVEYSPGLQQVIPLILRNGCKGHKRETLVAFQRPLRELAVPNEGQDSTFKEFSRQGSLFRESASRRLLSFFHLSGISPCFGP